MRGLALDIEPSYGTPAPYGPPVIGVVAAAKFPSEKTIRDTLAEGILKSSEGTLWVTRRPRKGTCDELVNFILEGQNTFVLDTNPWWKDWASDWRDYELMWCCSRVIVFHAKNSSRTELFVKQGPYAPHVILLEAKK